MVDADVATSGTHRLNNFDSLRLLGAFLVLIGHSYALTGRFDTPELWTDPISVVGLRIFFSISGFLIAVSWSSDPNLLRYLSKRCLRIFPALIVAVLLTVFFLGPIVTSLTVGDYFSSPVTWSYLSNILLRPVDVLPGVFITTPFGGNVNVSLWSLPAEFACYLMVPLVGLLPSRVRAAAFLALGVGSGLLAGALVAGPPIVFWGTNLSQAASVWVFFLIGAAIGQAKDVVPLRLDFAAFLFIGASVVAAVEPIVANYLSWFVLPYCVLAIGNASTPVLRRAGRFGDLSYGIYLYAFPVQQSVVLFLPELNQATSVCLVSVICIALAFTSWHLVEKQALKLKPRSKRTPSPQPLEAERSLKE
jgi:peptidoglycan/LPS O-acetylase OafA/YrhL